MASSTKDAAEVSKKGGESSQEPIEDTILPEFPEVTIPEKDESWKGPEPKEDPLKTPLKSNVEPEESKEDPSWMFYDTDDSPHHDSLDVNSDDGEGEGSDDDQPMPKKAKMDAEPSDFSEGKEVKD